MADPLDLVHLRTLVAIAETGGFRRAADSLHLSQPTVSQHVRLLEKRLKQSLVVKDGRGSRFTTAGERLVLEARKLLAAQDEVLQRFSMAVPDKLTIGSTEHAADGLLPELLAALRAAYPDVWLQFRIERSTSLAESVSKGAIDLAVVLGGNAEPVGTEVGSLALRWVAAAGWDIAEVAGPVPLVAFEEPCGLRRRAIAKLDDLGHSVIVSAESGNLDGVLAAARAGLGIALLPFSGPVPDGLVEVTDLPAMGDIDVRLVARRGLDTEVEQAAVEAVTAHYQSVADKVVAAQPHLQGVA
jgi:DNA-binding transcriptional LysR family regulator